MASRSVLINWWPVAPLQPVETSNLACAKYAKHQIMMKMLDTNFVSRVFFLFLSVSAPKKLYIVGDPLI